MAPVSQLVQFRLLLEQLNGAEFIRFITDETRESVRDIICTALFNHFSDCNQAASRQHTLETMMTITQDIIRSRAKPNNADQGSPVAIQSLSSDLIGEIASYLELKDHISFGRCQRATYFGCTSPCTLRALDLQTVRDEDFGMVDLCNFPQIRSLGFYLFDDLKFPTNQNICTHLEKLALNNGDRGDAEIEGLLNQRALSLAAITHLRLEGFCFFPKNKMMELLSKFSNTQCLFLDDFVWKLDDSSTSQLIQHLPNLSILIASCNPECLNLILSIFGKQIRALKVVDMNMEMPQNVCFNAIEELSMDFVTGCDSVMDTIRRSTKLLQRIHIQWMDYDNKSLVIDLLAEQKQLQQLVIDTECREFEEVCRAVDRAIFNIGKTEKKIIQIKLLLGTSSEYNASDIIYNLTKVVNTFKSSKIEQFLFRCKFRNQSVRSIENLETVFTYFKEQNSRQCDVHFDDHNIVVTNKGYADDECVFDDMFRGWLTDF